MKKFTLLLCSTAVLMPATAYAQSTGSVEFEKQTVIITGKRQREVGGVETPSTPKAKVVLTQEMISRQTAGQSILDTINSVPGVSFQNNDAYGSAGGTLTIRGFDSSRISLTFDGIQLNDSGNYAIFSNQQLDPELIEQVNVNLGSTDVDSPTASAVGGTVNYRTIIPTEHMGGRVVGSLGEWDFRRIFGLFNTGAIGPWGTRIFVAASKADNRIPFNNYGKINKQQYNARIWQPIGTNGDFVSLAGNYNQNRNNFFGSVTLRNDRPVPNGFPQSKSDRFYDINFPCQLDTPQTGVIDATAPAPPNEGSCGTEFDRRYNPSNTGNIRGSSRFTITDNIVLTVDPSYQYVKANGGGTVTGREGFFTKNGVQYAGFVGGSYWFGTDLNGDGDTLDTCTQTATGGCTSATNTRGVTLLAPSQTHTDRLGLIAGLRWDINSNNLVRVSYTLDHARHRQTGEVGIVKMNGEPADVFPINDPLRTGLGDLMEKRDRLSYAVLNQVSAEYQGKFGPVTVNAGVRLPFFERRLHNYCFTTSATGFVDCFGQNETLNAAYALAFPTVQGPQKRNFNYNKVLPSVGAVYDINNRLGLFVNYTKGLSVPSTDNLYNSFFFAPDTDQAKPKPETTDSFDGGVRYRSSKIQAQLSGWYTLFKNREAQAFDPELNQSVFRNLGTVTKYGIDGSVAYEPIRELTLYAFGSWMRSRIHDNIQIGSFGTGINQVTDCDNIPAGATLADITRSCAFTKGNWESGTPKYTYGVSAVGHVFDFDLGIQAKRTGPRYVFDANVPVFTGPIATPTEVFSAKTPAYWLVNLDVRYSLRSWGPELRDTYLQLNVYNLFDKLYVGGFGGGLNQAFSGTNYGNPPFVQIGAPRTVSGTLSVGF